MEFQPALFSTRVTSKGRAIFIDIKADKENQAYMKITETEVVGDERKRSYLNVKPAEMKEFMEAINQAYSFTAIGLEAK